jgi:hypothetical protein
MINNNGILSVAGDQSASAEQGSKGLLKLGLDMHYRQVTVAMQEEYGPIKAVGRMGHDHFGVWIEKTQRGLGDLQLLRSGSERLLAASGSGCFRGQKPGSSAQADGPG